jgi:hypothetical protein
MKVITGNPMDTVAGLFTQTEINYAQSLLTTLVNGEGRFVMPSDPYIIAIYRLLLKRFEEMQQQQ